MTTGELTLGPLGQIAVTVRNVDRATAFYRDILRVPLLFRAGTLSFFDCGGVRLMLSEPEGAAGARPAPEPSSAPAFVLYFRVSNIDEAHDQLSARGVAFEDAPHLIARMPDHELWMAFFEDGEGNTIGLMEERRA